MRTLSLFLALALSVVALPACDSSGSQVEVGGTYTAPLTASGFSGSARLTLPTTEPGGSFASFTLTPFGTSFTRTGSGSFDGSTITLRYAFDGTPTGEVVTGTVSGNGDTITFSGADVEPDLQGQASVVFTR